MTWAECPACVPAGVECYEHGPEDMDLARALAGFFQGKSEPDPEQVAWFLTDASVLRAEAGPGPYKLTLLEQGWHNEHAFILNHLVVVLGEGGKDCPATPEVVAKIPDSVGCGNCCRCLGGCRIAYYRQQEAYEAPREPPPFTGGEP